MTARLDEWACYPGSGDPYMAPELHGIVIVGRVTGHPRHLDGKTIRTSSVTGVEGRRVKTASGTEYELGAPAKSYRQWLREHRPAWDPDNPVTIFGGKP